MSDKIILAGRSQYIEYLKIVYAKDAYARIKALYNMGVRGAELK